MRRIVLKAVLAVAGLGLLATTARADFWYQDWRQSPYARPAHLYPGASFDFNYYPSYNYVPTPAPVYGPGYGYTPGYVVPGYTAEPYTYSGYTVTPQWNRVENPNGYTSWSSRVVRPYTYQGYSYVPNYTYVPGGYYYPR
jgi:hypothetical protein